MLLHAKFSEPVNTLISRRETGNDSETGHKPESPRSHPKVHLHVLTPVSVVSLDNADHLRIFGVFFHYTLFSSGPSKFHKINTNISSAITQGHLGLGNQNHVVLHRGSDY